MATIHPHGSGFRVHYWRDGNKKSPTLPSREAADLWMRENLAALHADTLIALADLWRAEDPTPHRIFASERVAKVAIRRGWMDPRKITKDDLRSWTVADKGWRRPMQYVLTILRWAHEVHHVPIHADVLEYQTGSAPKKAPQSLLTDVQAQAIRECALGYGVHAAAVVDYLLTYGARPITACRLTMRCLDPASGELVLPDEKHSGGWRHRVSPAHLEAWMALPRPPGPDAPLFPANGGLRPWRIKNGSAREITDWYKNTIGKRLKLGKLNGIYNLKRYAITRLLRATHDPATVASFTGHRDLSQVMTYARTNADRQDQALAAIAAAPAVANKPQPVADPALPPIPSTIPKFPSTLT